MPISFKSLGASSKIEKTDRITSTQSWTAPSDVSRIEILLCGGGASGVRWDTTGQNGGGGGSATHTYLTVTPGASYTVTIGAGGPETTGQSHGSPGSTSSFGGLLSVAGGKTGFSSNGGPGSGTHGGHGAWRGQSVEGNPPASNGYMGYGAGGLGFTTDSINPDNAETLLSTIFNL